jgi:fermentation-respiration switch protein FrsA (DUF1100 family)
VLSFIRWDRDRQPLVCVVNFAGSPHQNYRLGVPFAGTWTEVLNTDAEEFGGSGTSNGGSVVSERRESDGRPNSLSLTIPPLGAVYLTLAGGAPLPGEVEEVVVGEIDGVAAAGGADGGDVDSGAAVGKLDGGADSRGAGATSADAAGDVDASDPAASDTSAVE